jgi:redox-sensitive bicupin YhaK (pirin superfamily)
LNKFCPIAGNRGGMPLKQNAQVYAGIFTEDYTYQLSDRKFYLYVVTGSATINEIEASEGDGFAIQDETVLSITNSGAEILLFELRK